MLGILDQIMRDLSQAFRHSLYRQVPLDVVSSVDQFSAGYVLIKDLSASIHQKYCEAMLDTAIDLTMILFDSHHKGERGWLVSAASVMLHVAHVWVY
jgi:hypothetical protein